MKRRSFLKLAGAGGTIAVILGCARSLPTIPSRPGAEASDALSWIAWRDGRYTLSLPRAELGQNIATGLKQIACAELDVPWDRVDVTHADTASIEPWRATVGSESVQDFALPLAQACAALREAVAEGQTGEVEVTERPWDDLRAFRPGALPQNVALVGVEEIVTGQPLFAADIRLPGMVYGRVLRASISPEIASAPAAWNAAAAQAEPGFVALIDDEALNMNNSVGLGLVAATPGGLERIEAALSVQWDQGGVPPDDRIDTTLDIDRRIAAGGTDYEVRDDTIDPATRWDVDIRIDTPLAAHAAIEPRAAVADLSPEGGRLWAGTQDPFFVRDTLRDRLGGDITVIPMRTGGAFGGKVIPLVEIEAAALSRAVGRPVKVQWTRGQELALAYHRPPTRHRVQARLRDGRVHDWRHRMASGHVIYSSAVLPPWMQALTDLIGDDGAARNLATPYVIAAQSIGYDLDRLPIRTAAWRGLGAGPNTLASEVAMDAAARAAGADPVGFRLAHIEDPRLSRVLKTVQRLAGPGPAGQRMGRGVGCGIYKGVSYGAVIADVARRGDGTAYVSRLYCAHECGRVVNPDQVRAQCEGNLVWSLGMVLSDRLTLSAGGIAEADFIDAPIPTMTDVPPREVALVETNAPPSGAGETLMASAPAAIANAFIAASGQIPARLTLPLDALRA